MATDTHNHPTGTASPLCPACKIIIDCNGAASTAGGAFVTSSLALEKQLLHMIDEDILSDDQLAEASAWSQLQCNRAMMILGWANEALAIGRKFAGVYTPNAEYTVDGVNGIVAAGKLPA